jgi:hypothetical protein
MEVVHRVASSIDEQAQRELADLGIRVEIGYKGFDVSESASDWPAIRDWIERRHASDIARAKFTDQEISQASWLALRADRQIGYPQPDEEKFGYRSVTYDATEFCDRCGVGLRQVAAFQLKGEPPLGPRGILQLNWVYDEYFVRPEVWRSVFEPFGVGQRPVTDRSGVALRTVVQLVVEQQVDLQPSELVRTDCPSCGRIKYETVTRHPLPPLVGEPTTHMLKSSEWFGSGASAFHEVIVSKDLRRALATEKVRGTTFVPLVSAP